MKLHFLPYKTIHIVIICLGFSVASCFFGLPTKIIWQIRKFPQAIFVFITFELIHCAYLNSGFLHYRSRRNDWLYLLQVSIPDYGHFIAFPKLSDYFIPGNIRKMYFYISWRVTLCNAMCHVPSCEIMSLSLLIFDNYVVFGFCQSHCSSSKLYFEQLIQRFKNT